MSDAPPGQAWVTDVLGEPFEALTLEMAPDEEGPVVATLVRRLADVPTTSAVLYVHGFVDYFFQTHFADLLIARGLDFYALDLRKHGRSLRDHQTPNHARSMADYEAELDAAVQLIRVEGAHDRLLVIGHSTGGLITALWANARRGRGLIDGLFLNSPFLEVRGDWLTRNVAARGVAGLGRLRPYAKAPGAKLDPEYVQSIHRDHRGEWDFDLRWKPEEGFDVYAGWLAAVRSGHQAVAAGLAIDVPVLVMTSAAGHTPKGWDEKLRRADAVLDPERVARLAPRLGPHVTVVRIEGGLHDLMLSGEAARGQVIDELDRWVAAYLPDLTHRPRETAWIRA